MPFLSKENNFNIPGQLLIRPSLCAICAAEENPFKLSSEFVVERIFQQTGNLFNSIKCQLNIFVSNSNKQTIQINRPSGHSYLDVALSQLKECLTRTQSMSGFKHLPPSHMSLLICLPNMMSHLAQGLLNCPNSHCQVAAWSVRGSKNAQMKYRYTLHKSNDPFLFHSDGILCSAFYTKTKTKVLF